MGSFPGSGNKLLFFPWMRKVGGLFAGHAVVLPVHHDWSIEGSGMCYHVYVIMQESVIDPFSLIVRFHVKRSLLLWLPMKIVPFDAFREMIQYFTGVYIISRILHGRLEIRNFSSSERSEPYGRPRASEPHGWPHASNRNWNFSFLPISLLGCHRQCSLKMEAFFVSVGKVAQ